MTLNRNIVTLYMLASVFLLTQLRFGFDSNFLKLLSMVLPVGVVLLIFILNLTNFSRTSYKLYSNWYFLVFFVMVLLGVVQYYLFNQPDIFSFVPLAFMNIIPFVCLGVFLKLNWRSGLTEDICIKYLYSILAMYVFANFIAFILGFSKDWSSQFVIDYESGKAVMLGYIGIDISRVGFVFSNGFNSYAPVLAISIGAACLFSKKSLFHIFMLFISTASVLMIDSRSAILFLSLSLMIAFIIVKSGNKLLFYLSAFIVLLFPLLLSFVLSIISVIPGFEDVIFRSEADGETLNGRMIIWMKIVQLYSDFQLQHIFGFGILGQSPSGLSNALAMTNEFGNYVNADTLSAHNAYLQSLINFGYAGLFFIALLFSKVFKSLTVLIEKSSSYKSSTKLFFVYSFFVILFFCNTEFPFVYPGQLFFFFVSYLGILFYLTSPYFINRRH